ncbi:MAG: SycD/LcrH family type III secretion system chaperone [Desulfovibrionaceae bacterium]|nr:SycD/LcrH family type III secretion system chaperone [Desulfovibrionaceae bacterium]
MANENKGFDETLRELLESIKTNAQDLATKELGLSREELDDVRDALVSGAPLYQVLGMKEEMIEARYAIANQLYVTGKYKDAETVFQWLCHYSSSNNVYWMGLGAARQAQAKYTEALDAYQMAALHTSLEDPAPFYFSAICLMKQGLKEEAKVSLEAALTLAEPENPEHKSVCTKAENLLASLQ